MFVLLRFPARALTIYRASDGAALCLRTHLLRMYAGDQSMTPTWMEVFVLRSKTDDQLALDGTNEGRARAHACVGYAIREYISSAWAVRARVYVDGLAT